MTHTLKRLGVKSVVALGWGLGAWTSSEGQSLRWLGLLPGGSSSVAYGVSADGSVVVGHVSNRAFRWTINGGIQSLAQTWSEVSHAFGVSADGRVVVGEANSLAFRWENGVRQFIGTLQYRPYSVAYGVSADGTVVVGVSGNAGYARLAFRWRNGDMQGIGTPSGSESFAYGVSPDGSVIVGTLNGRAFRWQNGQFLDLGARSYEARSVSADGSVVVGWGFDDAAAGRHRAFRWVNGNLEYLGTFGGNLSYAYGVSADGSVVVGSAHDASGQSRAFRWTAQRGMQDLNQTYVNLLTNGSRLEVARAISPDGRYIVGSGYNAATGRDEAFLLDTWRTGDTNGDGCINDADLLNVLFAFGTPGTGYTRHEDINKDGTVDDADLLQVLFNFGSGC